MSDTTEMAGRRVNAPGPAREIEAPMQFKPYRGVHGERHYAWKGDAARETTKRERIQKRLSLEGVVCEYEGCAAPATDRHHIDGNTGNNDLSNIACLCRRHHMVEDGRLEALLEVARKNAEKKRQAPVPDCVHCGQQSTSRRRWKGRCHACNEYLRRNGVDRPDWLLRGEPKPPEPCRRCGKLDKPLSRGWCHTCYAYWRRTGRERPRELWDAA